MSRRLEQKRTAPKQLFPSPRAGERVEETPPVFSFVQECGPGPYTIRVRDSHGNPIFQGETLRCFWRPDERMKAGCYEWQLSCAEGETDWIPFEISENAVPFLPVKAENLWRNIPAERPRHLFCTRDIPLLLETHRPELGTLERNVKAALQMGLPSAPEYHWNPQATAYHEYFIQHREYVDRNLIACCLSWSLTGDEQARDLAIAMLMTLCSWNPEGPCALDGPWGDEVGLSHARCLPSAVDLLWNGLSPAQQELAASALAAYGEQCWRRLQKGDFMQNPGDSHAGRLPAYLGEIAMCLKGTDAVPEETLLRWLDYALDMYGGAFPFFGCTDGGWAEGVFYATSYTKWYLPFFSAVCRYGGPNFLQRPFYQRYASFLEHFVVPKQENYPFGDGYWCTVDSQEFPGFFAQNPYRVYAERTGSPLLKRFEREAAAPKLFELHLLDIFLPPFPQSAAKLPVDSSRAALFPEAGFLSLHTDPEHPQRDLVLLARGSKFGSVSHQHADQGSFCLKYGEKTLISPSGYYGRCYGTVHHREWTNTSQAHNTLLIGGEGQATWSCEATGQVLYARDEGTRLTGAVDGTHAYGNVKSWIRTFELTEKGLRVQDELLLKQPETITWCLHMLSRPQAQGNGLRLIHQGIEMNIHPREGLAGPAVVTDCFVPPVNEGVVPELWVNRPDQHHAQWRTPRSCVHRILVEFEIVSV